MAFPRKKLLYLLDLLNALSLDVILIALSWQGLTALVLDHNLSWYHPTVLALSLWIVYSWDHSLDAHKSDSLRHQLKGTRVLKILALLALFTDTYIAFRFLSSFHLKIGLVILLFCLTHTFLIARKKTLPGLKELSLSIIFTSGTFAFLTPMNTPTALTAVVFFALCFTAACLIAHYDVENDVARRQTSIATELPGSYTPLRIGTALSFFAGWLLLPHPLSYAAMVSSATIFLIHYIPSSTLKRLACDLALLSPITWLCFLIF